MSDTYSFGGFDFGGMPMGDWMANEFFPNPPPMPAPQPQPQQQTYPTPATDAEQAQYARNAAAARTQGSTLRDLDLRTAPPMVDTTSETYKFTGIPESTNVEDRRGRGSNTIADHLALAAETLPIQEVMDVFMPPILMDYIDRLGRKPITPEMLSYGDPGLSTDLGYWDIGKKRPQAGRFMCGELD